MGSGGVSLYLPLNFFFKIYFFKFIYFIYFWLHRVLVAARGNFVEAHGVFMAMRQLLSSCGVRVFSSLVVARRLQGTWAL